MKASFKDRLIEAMKLRNMTQSELGKKATIAPSSISDYLKERYIPKQDKIDKLAQALNVTPSWLMGYDVPIDNECNNNTNEASDFINIAAHVDGDPLSKAEQQEVLEFVKFIVSKRKKQNE